MNEPEVTQEELSIVDKEIQKAESKLVSIPADESVEKIYRVILSTKPPKQIVKYHSYGKFEYIPITLVERLLDGLFEWWEPEIIREGHVINGFYVVIRLRAKIPKTDKVLVADGIGFAEFQTSKGAAPMDYTQLMPNAGVLAVPKAKAEAIKNAAKSFGNLFGRNLARNDDNADLEEGVVNMSRKRIAKTLEDKNESD